jgi:queuine tRNA-ribosyltransferase
MNEEGAWFKSYVDGTPHLLSPETSIAMQRAIGSDIMMVLDQCIPSTAPRRGVGAGDGADAPLGPAIAGGAGRFSAGAVWHCAGGVSPGPAPHQCRSAFGDALRRPRHRRTGRRRDPGGALSVHRIWSRTFMPAHLPRYLMGVGTPLDILEAVHRGVDMFDCIIPSQLAQRGHRLHLARQNPLPPHRLPAVRSERLDADVRLRGPAASIPAPTCAIW